MEEQRVIICRTLFGSKLYGLDTPESDTDYKSVFMPTENEILTGQIPKSITLSTGRNNVKNNPEDVDHEAYSLHYFMQLVYQGQTVALDMLHGNKEEITCPVWDYLKASRCDFYTRSMRSFVGYARKQAAKYGVKGSRLEAVREALAFLITKCDRTVQDLYEHGELWEDNEHVHLSLFTLPDGDYDVQQSYWEVCGKKMTFGGKASHYVPMLKKFYDNYGDRARQAASNKGIDWKAISHAFRVAFQTQEIMCGRGFSYPLMESPFLRDVKAGKFDYTRVVGPALDNLMKNIEDLAKTSTLPAKVDTKKWQAWLADTTSSYLNYNRAIFYR